MRRSREEIRAAIQLTKSKKKIPYESESYKTGEFTPEELSQYEFTPEEISTITEYQQKLPILQQEDNSRVNARDLHAQLNIGRQFTDWIQNRISAYQLIENVDYFTISHFREIAGSTGFKTILDYNLTLDCAKQLAMIERTDIGAITRRYFIIIEKAYKNRQKWNTNRKGSLINCKELRQALMKHTQELRDNYPSWIRIPNVFANEFNLLNQVILGMSAAAYRETNGIKPHDQIRDHFTDDQLDAVDRLERYDAQLIMTQQIFAYEERKTILTIEYRNQSARRTTYI